MPASRWKVAIALVVGCGLLSGCSRSLGAVITGSGCQLHYTDVVPLETATTVLDFLVAEGFCSEEGRRVQVDEVKGALQLRIATKPEVRSDAAYLDVARAFAAQLSGKALEGRPVDVAICDEDLAIVTEAAGFRWGVHVAMDACELYVGPQITHEQGERFLAIVSEDLGCTTARAFRLSRAGDAIDLSFVLEDAALKTQEAFHQARLTAGRASTVVFDGAPIVVHVADVYHVSRRSAPAVVLGPSASREACTVFQGEDVDAARAKRFLAFAHYAGYCDTEPKTYYLSRKGGSWRVATVVRTDVSPELQVAFKTAFGLVAAMFRGAVFDGEPTSVDLCDPVFERCLSIIGPDLGRALTHKHCSVFYDPAFDTEHFQRFRAWMDSESFCDGPEQLLRIRREADGWAFHLAVRAQVLGSPGLATLAERLVTQLTAQVFAGESVRFVATDQRLLPAKPSE